MGSHQALGIWRYRHALFLLDQAGKVRAGPVQFLDRPNASGLLSLAFTGKEYVVAYRATDTATNWDIMIQRFSSAGKLAGAPLRIVTDGQSQYTRLLWTGDRLLLAYLQQKPGKPRLVVLRRLFLDRQGNPAGKAVHVTTSGWASSMDAAWTGSEVALAWFFIPSLPMPPIPPYRVQLARLRADGSKLQPIMDLHQVQTKSLARAKVAGDGKRLGVSWQEQISGGTQIRLAVTGCPAK